MWSVCLNFCFGVPPMQALKKMCGKTTSNSKNSKRVCCFFAAANPNTKPAKCWFCARRLDAVSKRCQTDGQRKMFVVFCVLLFVRVETYLTFGRKLRSRVVAFLFVNVCCKTQKSLEQTPQTYKSKSCLCAYVCVSLFVLLIKVCPR